MKIKTFQHWLIGLFGLAVLINLSSLTINTARDLKRLYHIGSQEVIWREVAFQEGERAANYIRFLRAHLPEASEIIFPTLADDPSRPIFSTPALQFYLLPRMVRNCLTMDCVWQALGEKPVLYFNDIQRNAFLKGAVKAVAFDAHWGVILPNTSTWSVNRVDFGAAQTSLLREFFVFLLGVLGLTFFGSQFVSLFLNDSGLENIVLGYGLGLAGFSSLAASLSIWFGSISQITLIGVFILLICLGGLWFYLKPKTRKELPVKSLLTSFNPWIFVYLLLTILAAILAVGKGYTAADEIQIWGLKGYGIALTGQVQSVTQWGTNTSAYPLNIPLLIASVKLIPGDLIPSAKLIFSLYYLCVLLVWDGNLKRVGVSRLWRGILTLLIGSTPLVFRHATLAYANLPFTFYLLSGGILLLDGAQNIHLTSNTRSENHSAKTNINKIRLGVLLLLAGAWTRPEGIILAMIIIGLGLVILLSKRAVLTAKTWITLSIPIIMYGFFWWTIRSRIYPNPMKDEEILRIALNQIGYTKLHLSQALYLLTQSFLRLWRLDIWGASGIALMVLIGFWLFSINKQGIMLNLYFLSGLLITLTIIGIYFILSFDPKHDLSWWINTGFDRMSLPGLLFLFYGLISRFFSPSVV
ncbi:MAG: hypothetical protein ACPL4H_03190 [Anaerolineales bacterium]